MFFYCWSVCDELQMPFPQFVFDIEQIDFYVVLLIFPFWLLECVMLRSFLSCEECLTTVYSDILWFHFYMWMFDSLWIYFSDRYRSAFSRCLSICHNTVSGFESLTLLNSYIDLGLFLNFFSLDPFIYAPGSHHLNI